jgi:hypothetical protein
MQFSQVAERGARQQEQKHIILSRDNGIIKFRFSVCSALSRFTRMLRGTASLQLKMTGVSCYVHTHHEGNELSRTYDVEEILRRPILYRCWRSVNLCE